MRASVRWIAAAVVGLSACGRASQKPDGGGRIGLGGAQDAGPGTGSGGSGGADGGLSDGGRADLPLSTGDFPYPGRWWGHLTGITTDAGTVDAGPFAIHWSASDPADRGLWTQTQVYPIAAAPGQDGGTIVTHAAPGTSGCWAFYPTSDPNALDVRPCNQPATSAAPVLGTFRRGPRLVAEIPLPSPTFAVVKIPSGGTGGGGDWVVFGVDAELWLWKRDTGQLFDLGAGDTTSVVLSPDGRRVLYWQAPLFGRIAALLAFDTATAEVTNLTATMPASSSDRSLGAGVFSPDGSKVTLHANISSISGSYDLLVHDFATGQTTTVAPHLYASGFSGFGGQAEIFLASGDHLVYGGNPSGTVTSGSFQAFGYELSTAKRITLGGPAGIVRIPGDAYAALQTGDGLVLIDDATFTPLVIDSLSSGGQFLGGGGLAPSSDGAELAYVDGQGVLHVRTLASGATLTVSGGAGCFTMPDPLAPAHSGASHAVAALFAADGAIIYNVGPGCGGGVYGLARYDRTTATQKIYTPLGDSASIFALSPLGGMVFDTPGLPTLLAWPGPPVTLQAAVALQAFSQDATFVFSAADRYLTYTTNGFLLVRDNRSGTVTQIAAAAPGTTVTSPINAVTVLRRVSGALFAYLPDGTSWQVVPRTDSFTTNPSTTKLALTCGDATGQATCTFPLEPGAQATMIGNGYPITVTDTQVIFRDVDGVCAGAL